KKKNQIQTFINKKKPYHKNFKISHINKKLKSLIQFIKNLTTKTKKKPPIILKTTKHYQTPIIHYLKKQNYLLIIINPLISYKTKNSNLQKIKTNTTNTYLLYKLYYKKKLKPYKKHNIQLLNLHNLTKQHKNITNTLIQTKLQFQTILNQIFPKFKKIFKNLYSIISLLTLKKFPSSKNILNTHNKILTKKIHKNYKNHSLN
ncbi:IS110 family transposase, partial [Alkalihalophilus marmarensis]